MAPGKLNPASQFVIPPTVQENNDTPPAAPPMVGLPAVFVPTTVKPSVHVCAATVVAAATDGAIPDRVASQSGLRHATYDDRLKWRGTAASRRESLLRGLVSAAPECFLPGPAEPHGGDDQTDH